MKKITAIALLLFTNYSYAMNCAEFNALGYTSANLIDTIKQPATNQQIAQYKPLIANYLDDLQNHSLYTKYVPEMNEALQILIDNKKLQTAVFETLSSVRGECSIQTSKSLKKVIRSNFDVFLKAIIKEHRL